MRDLTGKVVVVTGAARGMGKLEALNFGREGARVVVTDVDERLLTDTAGEMARAGIDVNAYVLDVSDRDACFAFANKVKAEVGPVDVLINNAGITYMDEVMNQSEQHIRRIMDVNYFGQVWMMQAVIPQMLERKTKCNIVNICSVAGKIGSARMGPYCASKHAAIGLTDSIRHELKGKNIVFTIVNPGYINTGMFEGAKVPAITHWQDPQTVADAVLNGVKKNQLEVCVPRFLVRMTALSRGLCATKLTDQVFFLLRGHKSFAAWKEDKTRPF
ncbi:MAG: SDR family NAD(P)-dependent oxidoreductase [Candidatus Geothermincolia bacterium]